MFCDTELKALNAKKIRTKKIEPNRNKNKKSIPHITSMNAAYFDEFQVFFHLFIGWAEAQLGGINSRLSVCRQRPKVVLRCAFNVC